MVVDRVGTGAGGRDFASHPNVLRMLVGKPHDAPAADPARDPDAYRDRLETNVDDLDPRLWPRDPAASARCRRLRRLADADPDEEGPAGAHPCRSSSPHDAGAEVREVIFTETSAIGLRELRGRQARARRASSPRSTCRATRSRSRSRTPDGTVVNVQPEYEDVAAAAAALGWSVKTVLAAATAAAWKHWGRG